MCVCKELQLFNTRMSLHLHLQFSMSANTKLKHMHMPFTLNCFCNLYLTVNNLEQTFTDTHDNENSSHRQPRHSYLSVLSSHNITSLQHFQTNVRHHNNSTYENSSNNASTKKDSKWDPFRERVIPLFQQN